MSSSDKVGINEAKNLVSNFIQKVLPPDVTSYRQWEKLQEEVDELRNALVLKDREEIIDALADVLYVTLGISHLEGVNLETAFMRVHLANMTKTRDGTYSPKGKDFVAPVHEEVPERKTIYPAPNDTQPLTNLDCAACNGTGQDTEVGACAACDGTGKVFPNG